MQKDKSVFITAMRNNDECIIYLMNCEVSCRCLVYISESLVLTKALNLQQHAFAQLILFNQNQVVSLLSTLINPSISAPNQLSISTAHGDFFF